MKYKSVCLSVGLSLTFVHPAQTAEIFSNVSSPFGTLTSEENFTEIVSRGLVKVTLHCPSGVLFAP